jgi:pumilio homology domain family member 6
MGTIKGQIPQMVLRHDASRVVQTILQFGTVEQRKIVLSELVPKIVDIAKTPYGHFAGKPQQT